MAVDTTPVLVLVAASTAPAAVKAVAEYTCDGTADQTEINAALAAVASAGGGLVQLTPGTFNLSATVTPTHGNTILAGSGWSTILKVNNATNIYAITFTPPGSTWFQGAVLRDFKVECNGANQTTAGGGINGFGAVWCKLDHLWIHQPWENGIWLHQDNLGGFGHHNEVVNCFFEHGDQSNGGNGRALRLEDSDENYVHANTSQDCGSPSLSNPCHFLDLAGLNHFVNNSFVVGYGAGIRLGGAHSTCIGNTTDGCKGHHFFIAGDKNVVSDNTAFNVGFGVTDNTVDAFYVENVGWNVITGNMALPYPNAATGRAGLSLNSSTNTIVQGNSFAPNGAFNWKTAGVIPGASTGGLIRDNYGYKTENSGTTAFGAAVASVASIAHGLNVTPAAKDFNLQYVADPLAGGHPWVSSITSTTFTLNITTTPGGSGTTVGWQVQVL
jgi:hypothetical protein